MAPRVAMVTGGARRIGATVARELARRGYAVAVHCNRSRDEGRALAAEIRAAGGHAREFVADLRDLATLDRLVAEVGATLGPVELLVNNASAFEYDDAAGFGRETWDLHMEVNALAPIHLARLVAAQPGEFGIAVVNLLDQKLFNPNPDFLTYTLSKAVLSTATELLAMALRPRVRVCAVAPGLTLLSGEQSEENFARVHDRTALGRGSTPQDIAEAVAFLAGPGVATGTVLLVDGGQHMVRSDKDVMFL